MSRLRDRGKFAAPAHGALLRTQEIKKGLAVNISVFPGISFFCSPGLADSTRTLRARALAASVLMVNLPDYDSYERE